MSDQGYTSAGGDENVGICCRTCTPLQRKIGYYVTFLVGIIVFVLGILNSFGFLLGSTGAAFYLAAGGLIIVFNPLWVKSCSQLLSDMKQPVRLVSSIIFVTCLVCLIIFNYAVGNDILTIIFSIATILSGIWYFLSYFEHGQQAFIACCKVCCCGDKNNSPSGGEN